MRLPGQTSEDREGPLAHIAAAGEGEAVGARKGIDPLVESVSSVLDLIIPRICASANGARDHGQKRLHICSDAH